MRNSRHEARKACRLLSLAIGQDVAVNGVVVDADADAFTVRSQPVDVHVVNRRALVRYLRRRPQALDWETVHRIFSAARLSTTWAPAR